MASKRAIKAVRAYLVERGGHAVERFHRVKGGDYERQPDGVAFHGATFVPHDLVELVERQSFEPTLIEHRDDEMGRFLAGVEGVVEATREEEHQLWARHHEKRAWVSSVGGLMPTIGLLVGRPICLSLSKASIDGQSILFVDACSTLVDHDLVRRWLEAHVPAYAGNHTDATNFHNVLRS